MSRFREKWEKYGPRLGIIAIAAFALIGTTVIALRIQEEVRQNSFSVYAALAEERRAEMAENECLQQQADAALEMTVESAAGEAIAGETTDETEQLIYATPGGKRYHNNPQCPGKNSVPITWDDVQRRGLTPCKKCVK